MTKFLTILCAFLCLQHSVEAWNAEGHMVVAQLAYNHLTPSVKAQCDALIAMPVLYASSLNNTFVTAAAYADDIKSSTSAYSTWHYIDIPFSLDTTLTNGFTPPAFDVVRAIQANIAVLQNPSSTQSNRAFHLRLLIHFIGDIQQPLHCSTAISASQPNGDAGGNGFLINSGFWDNLHSLWDSGGGYLFDSLSRPLSASAQNILNAKVALIEADYPYNYTTNLNSIPNPMTWAQEGLNLARTNCYTGITNNTAPTGGYLNKSMATTEERLAMGGHHLADLLNTVLSTNAVTLKATVATNNFIFSWYGLYGRTYKLQWKQNLTDPTWNALTNIVATANQIVSLTEPVNQTMRFYRVVQ